MNCEFNNVKDVYTEGAVFNELIVNWLLTYFEFL